MQFKFFALSRRALMRLYQARAWRGERAKGSGTSERGEVQVKTIECPQVSPAKQKKPKFSDAIDVTDTPIQGALGEGNQQKPKRPAKKYCRGTRDGEFWEPSVVSITEWP